jgi:hypothetical protein
MRCSTKAILSRLFISLFPFALLVAAAPAGAWIVPAEPGVSLEKLAIDCRGNLIAGGQGYLAQYSAAGRLLWRQPAPGFASLAAVVTDARGDIYVAGSDGVPDTRFVIARYAGGTGRRLWRTVVPHSDPTGNFPDGAGQSIALTPAGDPVASGYDGGRGLVVRVAGGTGAICWEWEHSDAGNNAVAVDRAGNVAFTGSILAAKLNGGTGDEIWRVARSNTPAGRLGGVAMRAVVIERNGDFVVGGQLRNVQEDYRVFYIARLDGASGAVEWEVAGPPRPEMEGVWRLALPAAGALYAGGRLGGLSGVLRVKPGGERAWVQRPWSDAGARETDQLVTDLEADARGAYVSGSDRPSRFRIHAYTPSGLLRWQLDLGEGTARDLALGNGSKLYAVGWLPEGGGGRRSVIAGIQAARGRHLAERRR